MLNRLYFLFFFCSVFFYQQIPLLSPLAAAKGLLLQASAVSLGYFTLCVSVPGAVGSLWDPGSTPAVLGGEGRRKTESWISCPKRCLPSPERGREKKEGQLCVASSPIPCLK